MTQSLLGEQVSLFNRQHLFLKLARVDVLIRRTVRCWQLAGQDFQDQFRGLIISDEEVNQITHHPIGHSWGSTVELPAEEDGVYIQEIRRVDQQEAALLESCEKQGIQLQFNVLQQVFNLDAVDLDILLICLAPAFDIRYERIYSYLQDDVTRKSPGVNLILTLLGEPGMERLNLLSYFSPNAPLFRWGLIDFANEQPGNVDGKNRKNLIARELQVDATLVTWLMGRYEPRPEMLYRVQLSSPAKDELDCLLAAPLASGLEIDAEGKSRFLEYWYEDAPVIAFWGPDQAGQDAAARQLAVMLNCRLLHVDFAGLIEDGLPARKALQLVLRDALLLRALPYICGWDACFIAGEPGPRDVLENVFAHPGAMIIASKMAWQVTGVERNTPLYWIEFPMPEYQQRLKIWGHYLGPTGLEVDSSILAGQFALTSSQIRDSIRTAQDRSMQRGKQPVQEDYMAAARYHSNPRLGSLARKITPRYTRKDIVLPKDQLRQLDEIVSMIKKRAMVLSEWGLVHKLVANTGVPILFSGESGTGKTMAAEVIAGELNLDLYKIDLSTLVSKYIGETEKNLEQIFREAESSNAILFFDEADAIFGKRSEVKDAHDRYANIEISYLLQRMEAYDGVTILATNLRSNLDEAFTRRLQFLVDFPPPDEHNRLLIWQTLFPKDVPADRGLDLAFLARRFNLAGGNIRNVLVSATYLAASDGGCITMGHLLHGVRRELQKIGRHVYEADMVIKAE